MPDLSHRRALIIIAYEDYNEREFAVTRDFLGMFGAETVVASYGLGTATGRDGGSAEVDCLLSDVKPDDFDAIIFIGGVGSVALQNNDDAHRIARGALSNGKIVGAICIAPIILAKAGVLSGRSATVWTDSADSHPAEELVRAKAKYVDEDVVVDGRLVTANGPDSAEKFARSIAALMSK